MKKILIAVGITMLCTTAVIAGHHLGAEVPANIPAKLNKAEISGTIFERPGMLETKHEDGHVTLEFTSLLSSDKKFASGMYRSDKIRSEINKPYVVDEFMYFLEGSVTLTSTDGSIQVINAGEGVTVPKEWTGVFETDGYTKIWVIYSSDGSRL